MLHNKIGTALSKILSHSSPTTRNDENNGQVRNARHRYERPANLLIQRDPRNQQVSQSKTDCLQSKYAKLVTDMLYFHNYYRAIHSAPPLTISYRLNSIAQNYANYLAKNSKFEHSKNRFGNEILGENLYMQWISEGPVPISSRTTVASWYSEINDYDFKHPKYSEETGHFTQMVWKSTKRIGIGIALSSDGREVYFVANYYPAGNIINHGYFEKNVLAARNQ